MYGSVYSDHVKVVLVDFLDMAAEQASIPEMEIFAYSAVGIRFLEALMRIVYPNLVVFFNAEGTARKSLEYASMIRQEKAYRSITLVHMGGGLGDEDILALNNQDIRVIESIGITGDKVKLILKSICLRMNILPNPFLPHIRVIPERLCVVIMGREITLNKKEFILLQYLYSNPDRLISRKDIMSYVWKDRITGPDRTLDVHLSKIRKKTGLNNIISVRNMGFRMDSIRGWI